MLSSHALVEFQVLWRDGGFDVVEGLMEMFEANGLVLIKAGLVSELHQRSLPHQV